jgi:8-oxo-dGTP diphosphatase
LQKKDPKERSYKEVLKMNKPTLTVDIIIEFKEGIVLIKRKNNPFENLWAIPGGIVEFWEKVEDSVIREAKEETNLDVKLYKILGVYSDPNRDPRGHYISVTFIAQGKGKLKAGSDAKEAGIFKTNKIPEKLAFDHNKMLNDYLKLSD